ncbi:hypothetical protein [Micromonospora sp. NPDC093277]|uniref:hypothetical protein n=1 Tax=Micromonospora sp. NPDC093277 TaxID=3364291 RepID=UPI0037F6CDAA
MHVLFLALGGTRRRAVIEESAQVVADGGTAVVLVGNPRRWEEETFDPGVEVIELSRLEQLHPASTVEKVLFNGPGVLLRLAGRGPLRPWATKARRAYARRVSIPAHRAFILPADRPTWGEWQQRLIFRHVLLQRRPFDLLVVSDLPSMVPAARLLAGCPAGNLPEPQVSYSYDTVAPLRVTASCAG